jgi:hypothetical protein
MGLRQLAEGPLSFPARVAVYLPRLIRPGGQGDDAIRPVADIAARMMRFPRIEINNTPHIHQLNIPLFVDE